MRTEVLNGNEAGAIIKAANAVLRGELVAFPTDTVYGIGCNPWSEVAIRALYAAKQRPFSLAIPVLLASPEAASSVALTLPKGYIALARAFWPGGLTIVVPKSPRVPLVLSGGRDSIALRLPDHAVARALADRIGGCIAATSANLSGRPAAVDATSALSELEGVVSVLLDGGLCREGVASTIVDLTADPPRVLRQGAISYSVLRDCLPELLPIDAERTDIHRSGA